MKLWCEFKPSRQGSNTLSWVLGIRAARAALGWLAQRQAGTRHLSGAGGAGTASPLTCAACLLDCTTLHVCRLIPNCSLLQAPGGGPTAAVLAPVGAHWRPLVAWHTVAPEAKLHRSVFTVNCVCYTIVRRQSEVSGTRFQGTPPTAYNHPLPTDLAPVSRREVLKFRIRHGGERRGVLRLQSPCAQLAVQRS